MKTPQQIRRKELEAEYEVARKEVYRRDKGKCFCGARGTEIHHILGRYKETFADIRFLRLVCRKHNPSGTGNLAFKRKLLRDLRALWHYVYLEKYNHYLEEDK